MKTDDITSSKKRKYLPSWKTKWPWLMYDPVLDVVECQSCIEATERNLLKTDKRGDDAFTRGFKNWDIGPDRFTKHEVSASHSESIINLATIKSVPSVDSRLSVHISDGQKLARDALKAILTSLRFLATQNIAVQGHS